MAICRKDGLRNVKAPGTYLLKGFFRQALKKSTAWSTKESGSAAGGRVESRLALIEVGRRVIRVPSRRRACFSSSIILLDRRSFESTALHVAS